jgi:hypothetical protein
VVKTLGNAIMSLPLVPQPLWTLKLRHPIGIPHASKIDEKFI